MKIKEIRAFEIELTPKPTTPPRVSGWTESYKLNRPVARYPQFNKPGAHVSYSDWKRPACLVIAEDGTWGFGISLYGPPVVSLINDHFAPNLIGENCMAIEKHWDMMVRLSSAFGATSLTESYAIKRSIARCRTSKGKHLQRPVYELLGGPQRIKSSAMPRALTRSGIWSWASKPLSSLRPGDPITAWTAFSSWRSWWPPRAKRSATM
ncbi:MAG: hypothetical protein R3A44_08935 [Caldilineaceae bacterium]